MPLNLSKIIKSLVTKNQTMCYITVIHLKNYIELIKGNKLPKAYSLDEIRNTAIDMHNNLREIKVTEVHKPIFIAGILIALNDNDFVKTYNALPSYNSVIP